LKCKKLGNEKAYQKNTVEMPKQRGIPGFFPLVNPPRYFCIGVVCYEMRLENNCGKEQNIS
jgi:hypothetical protein